MQRNLILSFLSIFFLVITTSFALASSPSPASSEAPTPLSTNEVTDNLKNRLKDVLEEGSNNTPSSSYRAIIGQVHDVIQKTLAVDTKDGRKQVVVNEETTLLRSPGNVVIKLENIRIDDYLIAMGTIKDEDTFIGKRLIVSTTKVLDNTKKSGYGQITELKKSSFTLTSSGNEQTIYFNNKTRVKSKDNPSLKTSDLELNTRLIFTAEIDDDDDLVATTIMIIK